MVECSFTNEVVVGASLIDAACKTSWASYCVVSEKHIPRNMLSLGYFRNGRQNLTMGYVGTIFMDLSKAYDCLSHDLLIAKLEA